MSNIEVRNRDEDFHLRLVNLGEISRDENLELRVVGND